MKTELVQSLLMDVRITGSSRIEKKKLMWLLGRANEGKNAWALLLDEWVEVGEKRDTLHGVEWGSYITLVGTSVECLDQSWAA